MNILLPMTGDNRFKSSSYFYPKPLVEVGKQPMVQLAIEQYLALMDVNLIPIIASSDSLTFNLDLVLERICEGYNHSVVKVDGDTAGSLCTALLALEKVADEQELLIVNYDQYLGFDIEEALELYRIQKNDFGVVCFESAHPKWSYVALGLDNSVIEAAEKKPISKNALAGFYYFKNKSIFLEAAAQCILEAPVDKKVFFTSDVLNHCVLKGYTGSAFHIDRNSYAKFTDPTDVDGFLMAKQKGINSLAEKYAHCFVSKNIEPFVDSIGTNIYFEMNGVAIANEKSVVIRELSKLIHKFRDISLGAIYVDKSGKTCVIKVEEQVGQQKNISHHVLHWNAGILSRLEVLRH